MMHLRSSLIAAMLAASVAACGTPGDDSYLDRTFRESARAYTNVFELLKGYSGQTEAPGQMGGVRVIRYYEANQRYAGYTNKAESWFSPMTEDELKTRLVALIKKRAGRYDPATDRIEGPVRVNGGFGFYLDNGDCNFIAVFKRVGPTTIYDNDYGDPDFIGFFDICNGLTVGPAAFVEKIGLADEAAEARFLSLYFGKKRSGAATPTAGNQASSRADTTGREAPDKNTWEI